MIFKKYKFRYDSSIDQVIDYITFHTNTSADAHAMFASLTNPVENEPNFTYNRKRQSFIIYYTIHDVGFRTPSLYPIRFYGKMKSKNGKTILTGRFLLLKPIYIIYFVCVFIPDLFLSNTSGFTTPPQLSSLPLLIMIHVILILSTFTRNKKILMILETLQNIN